MRSGSEGRPVTPGFSVRLLTVSFAGGSGEPPLPEGLYIQSTVFEAGAIGLNRPRAARHGESATGLADSPGMT